MDWTLEWSECHPGQCWAELMALWSLAEFKACMLHCEEVSKLEWHSTRDTESSVEAHLGYGHRPCPAQLPPKQ